MMQFSYQTVIKISSEGRTDIQQRHTLVAGCGPNHDRRRWMDIWVNGSRRPRERENDERENDEEATSMASFHEASYVAFLTTQTNYVSPNPRLHLTLI